MAKVVKFPDPTPEKFGPQRVSKKKPSAPVKPGQLNLFTGGKIVRLHQLSPFEEALLLDDQGQGASAKQSYQKAIEEHDSSADAYCNLGILEFQDSNYPKAIDCFTRCLKEEPRHFEAHYNLANLYAEVGNLALAKFHYQTSIEIEPTFTNSYFNLALTLAMNKEFQEAVNVLHRYLDIAPAEEHHLANELIRQLASAI